MLLSWLHSLLRDKFSIAFFCHFVRINAQYVAKNIAPVYVLLFVCVFSVVSERWCKNCEIDNLFLQLGKIIAAAAVSGVFFCDRNKRRKKVKRLTTACGACESFEAYTEH